MQHDDVVWSIINKSFCSHKVRTASQNFCKNEYNLTGFCSRAACPLANSEYATVREENGIIYLFVRRAERVSNPQNSWEKIKLSRNFEKAIQQINENLLYWNGFIKSKCKQRFVKITQYLIRMRKLRLRRQKLLVPLQRKVERRESRREEKALIAARIEKEVEKSLLERLRKGTYKDLYNINQAAFENALDEEEIESEGEESLTESETENVNEYIEAESEDEEDDMSVDSESGQAEEIELASDFESDADIEDCSVPTTSKSVKQKKRKSKTAPRLSIAYENDEPELLREKVSR